MTETPTVPKAGMCCPCDSETCPNPATFEVRLAHTNAELDLCDACFASLRANFRDDDLVWKWLDKPLEAHRG